MEMGAYATIKNDRVAPVLNGMFGHVTRIYDWGGEKWCEITAENYGPYMSTSSGGERKVRAWVAGNKRSCRIKDVTVQK